MSPIETYDNTTQLRQDYVHHCLQTNITNTRNFDSNHNSKNLLPVTKDKLINHYPQRGDDNISPRLYNNNRTRQLFGVQIFSVQLEVNLISVVATMTLILKRF